VSAGRAPTGVRGRRSAFLVLCTVGVLGAAGGAAALCGIGAADGRNVVVATLTGGHRTADFGPAPRGVEGRALTMPAGSSAERLSFSSAAPADDPRFSRADGGRVARAHAGSTVAGPGGGSDPSKPAKKRVSLASLGWAVLAVAVLAAAVGTPLLLRRHRNRQDTPP